MTSSSNQENLPKDYPQASPESWLWLIVGIEFILIIGCFFIVLGSSVNSGHPSGEVIVLILLAIGLTFLSIVFFAFYFYYFLKKEKFLYSKVSIACTIFNILIVLLALNILTTTWN